MGCKASLRSRWAGGDTKIHEKQFEKLNVKFAILYNDDMSNETSIMEQINKNRFDIDIDGQTVTIRARLSIVDFEHLDTDKNYRKQVNEIANAHIVIKDNEPIAFNDYALAKFVSEYVNANEEIQEIYYRIECDDEYKKFILTLVEYRKIVSEKLKPSLLAITNLVNSILEPYNRIGESFIKAAGGLLAAFTKALNSIKIPALSEEEKQKWIKSNKVWGNYGWTMPPSAQISIFRSEPINSNDAYQKMRRYITNEELQELFQDLRSMDNIKQSDLDEAIFDFEHAQYKSCVLILFGMIDSRLIRSQKKSGNGRRESGTKAALYLRKKYIEKYSKNDQFYSYIIAMNLFVAIMAFFREADDFSKQPKLANRNFVDHGMFHRKICKKDCVQLFWILYNLTWLMNY